MRPSPEALDLLRVPRPSWRARLRAIAEWIVAAVLARLWWMSL